MAQVAEFLKFDEELRAFNDTSDYKSIPLGYIEFCKAWNEGAAADDPRRLSTVYLADDPAQNEVELSNHPLQLPDFHITPAQAGYTSGDTPSPPDPVQDAITQEFAAIMAFRQKKERQFREDRREKRNHAFKTGLITTHPNATRSPAFKRRQRKRAQDRDNTTTPFSSLLPEEKSSTNADSAKTSNMQAPEAPTSSAPMDIINWSINLRDSLTIKNTLFTCPGGRM